MSDRLREAIERVDGAQLGGESLDDEPEYRAVEAVTNAARRFLALTETGERVNWCETHLAQSSSGSVEPDRCGWDRFVGGECSIVPKFLADYLEDTDA